MNLTIKGKQIDVGDALRTHVTGRLTEVIGKYFENPLEGSVVFSRDRHHMFRADIQVHIGRGIVLQSSSEASEAHPAFDLSLDKLSTRLRRYKSRLRDHHKRSVANGSTLASPYYILQPEAEDSPEENSKSADNPVIVAEMTTSIENLTVGEAVMRMDLADTPALVFRNRAHGKLNVIYRRNDGHIGWIDPREI
ncbi:MAG: ribosome-associated translation inhibitor RaiA [Pseudomonadota bacterium]|nr:ribosome-associated translation inhibitor RaiA [Pseudomonadota bacterium]